MVNKSNECIFFKIKNQIGRDDIMLRNKLDVLYNQVNNLLNKIDFERLWNGFRKLKFALYNEYECIFDGKFIEKTDEFLGNTSIKYKGEYIAIWNLIEDISPVVLCSKIVHEMFHGYQMQNNESRFPNEIEAIYNYNYISNNIEIKLVENNLLTKLYDDFDIDLFHMFLRFRKYRLNQFNFEFLYESKIEQIEGVANYIELSVLKELDYSMYQNKILMINNKINDPTNMLPIRVVSYDIGALLLLVLNKYNISYNHQFNNKTISEELQCNVEELKPVSTVNLTPIINDYHKKSEEIINKAIKQNNVILDYETILLGFNVYNARYYKNYIISRYFIMFGDEANPTILYGDFVVKTISVGIIRKVYKI